MAEKVVIGNAELYLGDCREILPTLPKVDALELRAYEATVQNLEQRIKDLQLEMLANGEAQRVPEGWWKHICNALCVDGLELWVAACPHCGMPRSAAPAPKKEGE